MNTLHIIGNLTANPKSRVVNTANGTSTVCDFTVATNRYVKGKKVAEYFRVTLWERAADNAMKYLTKGRKVAVTGPVEGRPYMGNDGKPRVSMEIRQVKEIEYLSSRAEDEGDQEAPPPDDGFVPVDDEELPF